MTTHPTQLQLSMHADGALAQDEQAIITEHLESCTACQASFASIKGETRLIDSAMQITPEEAQSIAIPKYSRPVSLRGFALANVATGLLLWLAQFLWKTVFGELVMNATTWATSIYLPDVYTMASTTALYLLEEGTAMLDTYLGLIVVAVSTFVTLWLLFVYRKHRAATSMSLLIVAIVGVAAPTPVNALDIRRDTGVITIAASETIEDTLVVAAETVLIQGTVTGDVIAVGANIDVSGSVGGNLFAFADTVKVRGSVGGISVGAGSSIDLDSAKVAGDVWIAGQKIDIDSESSIGRNATIASQSIAVGGSIDKDLYAFGESVELSGDLNGNLEAFANRVRLLGDAHVAGNVRFRSGEEDRLYRAETVRIDGEVEFPDMPEEFDMRSPYTTVEFYLWQLARLVMAFLVGLALLWLAPDLRYASISAGTDGLKTAGIGFVTLIGLPIMALVIAITLIGLPFTIVSLFLWLLGIYLAKIVVGAFVGRMLLANSDSLPLTLLAGLAAIIVVVNLPFIGGILNFLLTIIGFGLLVRYVVEWFAGRDSEEAATG